jgi:hypothetical protein
LEKASRSGNEYYPFRIKSAPGGSRTLDLALTRQTDQAGLHPFFIKTLVAIAL